jgi:hypothetical protein
MRKIHSVPKILQCRVATPLCTSIFGFSSEGHATEYHGLSPQHRRMFGTVHKNASIVSQCWSLSEPTAKTECYLMAAQHSCFFPANFGHRVAMVFSERGYTAG